MVPMAERAAARGGDEGETTAHDETTTVRGRDEGGGRDGGEGQGARGADCAACVVLSDEDARCVMLVVQATFRVPHPRKLTSASQTTCADSGPGTRGAARNSGEHRLGDFPAQVAGELRRIFDAERAGPYLPDTRAAPLGAMQARPLPPSGPNPAAPPTGVPRCCAPKKAEGKGVASPPRAKALPSWGRGATVLRGREPFSEIGEDENRSAR